MSGFSQGSQPEQLINGSMTIIGEQNGPPERKLKARLVLLFGEWPQVFSAYLLRFKYTAMCDERVGLFVVTDESDGEQLATAIGQIFADLFSSEVSMDIFFIRRDREPILAGFGCAFFRSVGA